MNTQDIAAVLYDAVAEEEGAYASPRVLHRIRDTFIEKARTQFAVDLSRFRKRIRITIAPTGHVNIAIPEKALTYARAALH